MYPNTNIAQDSRTLWMGDIEHWMDENFVSQLFQNTGLLSVKVIRDKNSGLPAGYGFVEFQSHEIAQQVLNTYNGSTIPGTHKTFRLNWGVFGSVSRTSQQPTATPQMQVPSMGMMGAQRAPMGGIPMGGFGMPLMPPVQQPIADFSIYVQDLDPVINEQQLAEFFRQRYKSVLSAKIIYDPVTKLGKGYGFVKFQDQVESQKALSEMNGALFRGRHIKTNSATWKSAQMSNLSYQQNLSYMSDPSQLQSFYGMQMQQQMMQNQTVQQPSVQVIQPKPANTPNLQKRVEKPSRLHQRDEYSENSVEYIINKIETDSILKFTE